MPPTRRSLASSASAHRPQPVTPRTPLAASKRSSAKSVHDMIPATCTPDYEPPPPRQMGGAEPSGSNSLIGGEEANESSKRASTKGKDRAPSGGDGSHELGVDDRGRVLQELLGFHPRTVVEDISEACRKEIYSIAHSIDQWANMTHGRAAGTGLTEEERSDLEQGPHRLETLLESHMDSACDKFTAWCLRNTFHIPDHLEVVLPWHQGLDFDRATYIAQSSEGEEGIQRKIDGLRSQVIEMRKLKYQLELANKRLDKQARSLELEKKAAGFVLDLAEETGLAPLPQAADALTSILKALYAKLEPFETIVPTPRPVPAIPDSDAKIWEYGRAAYLNWAAAQHAATTMNQTEGKGETTSG